MQKRIAIATIGTLGDVLPYISLALALKEHGYSVVLGTNADFEDVVTGYGVEFYSLGSHIEAFLKKSYFEDAMNQNMLLHMPALLKEGHQIVDTAARRGWKMAQGADAILLHMNTSFGIDIAEALNIPAIMSALQPLNTTKEFPLCEYDGPDLGPAFNRLSYAYTEVQQAFYDLPRNKLRRELMGLEPRRKGGFFKDSEGHNLTTLYAFSQLVSPRPRDWPKSAIVTGYWRVEDNADWKPSARFEKFLSKGSKPVYIGFGSMPFGAERNTQILKEAVVKWGGRAVVARGWGGINPDHLPDNIYAISRAPHDKLFKHVSGVVHHGGAGTTAAGLYAGLPTFVVPQAVDQPYWGRRVHDLGCGPQPVKLRKLTPDILAESLHGLTTYRRYRENAEALAIELAAEDGPAKAIKRIDLVINNFRSRPERKRA